MPCLSWASGGPGISVISMCSSARNVENAPSYLEEAISGACAFDRAGSTIFEELLDTSSGQYPHLPHVGTAEVVAIATWFLWWIIHTVTHRERTPLVASWKLSVLALCTNFTKTVQKSGDRELVKWTKPDVCQVKLNIDASFHSGEGDGATGAVLRDKHGNFLAG